MTELAIKSERIGGIAVYGIPQLDYSLDGFAHQDFDTVVAKVSMHQASIVEQQTDAIASAIRLRQSAAQDLGNALAKLSGLLNRYPTKDQKRDDLPDPIIKVDSDEGRELINLKNRLKTYGYDLVTEVKEAEIHGDCSCHDNVDAHIDITRGECMKGQARVQELVDIENNNIQQDMNTLNGFVTKRDKAYNNAEKVVKKYEDTAITIIKAMNQ